MKNKFRLLLCMLVLILSLAGCASEKSVVAYDQTDVVEQIEFLMNYCQNADDATMSEWNSQNDFSKNYQFMLSKIRMTPQSFDSAIESWNAGVEECGEYVSHGDYQFTTKKDELEVTLPVQFKNRNATILFVFDKQLYLQSVTVNAEYALEEILQKAGQNTILGMGTVFAVLIFISILISLFKFIPRIQEAFAGRKKKDKRTEPSETSVVEKEEVETVQEEMDDLELVAVIAAAIAAYEGTDTDGFVVRSIKRRPSNKWNA